MFQFGCSILAMGWFACPNPSLMISVMLTISVCVIQYLGSALSFQTPQHFRKFYNYPCAFGFSHKTNQYKVVLSLRDSNSPNYQTDIYTLGECSWRSIGNSSYHIRNDGFCAFLNGALHWIHRGLEGPFICCFDFVSEQFGGVPEPSELNHYQKRVSVINGNLSICDFSKNQIAIWVMKEYGVKESWSKDIVITCPIYGFHSYEPIMINGSGKILMIYDNWSFVFYDPESKALIDSELPLSGSRFEAIAHVPSLISLKDVAKRIK